ncbi:MAG TPA: alpha/beta hydrolase [Mycobacteriales bacterium]|nr:alpha/beta hydrolase [Mycobacteriales bacterium]
MTIALTVVAAVAVCLVGAALLQRWLEARDRRRFAPPGRLVQVGDELVHVVVEGSGPTVLIDSGLGGSSIEWAAVSADLAADFTVVRYDRPGFAWSPPGGRHTPVAAANRIERLLTELDVPAPWILVGHSMGGLTVRLVASLFPDHVAGLVLVDPSHEAMLDDDAARRSSDRFARAVRAVVATARFGTARVVGRAYAKVVAAQARQPIADGTLLATSTRLTLCTVHGLRAVAAELVGLPAALAEVAATTAQHPLPPVPLTVITAAAPARTAAEEKARDTIGKLHAQQAAAVPLGRQVLATRSGHLVPLDQPELVAAVVRQTAVAATSGAWGVEVTAS